jgi:hypothetical protein
MKVQYIDTNGYRDCIEISNQDTRLVLEPSCGGRILYFEHKGVNLLFIDPDEDGYLLESGKPPKSPLSPCAGRCDIGPEMTTPPHPGLWLGRWKATILDSGTVEMISPHDPGTGLRLRRYFSLDEHLTKLKFNQVIRNEGEEAVKHFHWSRTFCRGGGIAVAPLNERSRYPEGYLVYGPGEVMNYRPAGDPAVIREGGLLQIVAPPLHQKFALDLSEGWLAYLTRESRLLVKKFPVYGGRIYGEMASNNMSFWYNGDDMCEVEVIGPEELIEPGEEADFTETWYAMEYLYPGRTSVEGTKIRKIIDLLTM